MSQIHETPDAQSERDTPASTPELATTAVQAIVDRLRIDDQADARAANQQLAVRQAEALAVRDRVPAFVRHASASELARRVKDPELVEVARTWRWGAGNVLFAGPTDLGKSTAAAILFRCVLARAVAAGGREWEFAQTMQWFGAERLEGARREQRLGAGEASEIGSASRARLLVLDDAGWDTKDRTVVSEIMDARYELGFPTIITTGKSGAELVQFYGAAVVRRMLEAGGKKPTIVDAFRVATPRQAR